jgi:hypothetical protein
LANTDYRLIPIVQRAIPIIGAPSTETLILGVPRNLLTNILPTYTDVMKKYFQFKQDLKIVNGKYHLFLEVSRRLCYEVEEIWEMTSLPTVKHAQVIEK